MPEPGGFLLHHHHHHHHRDQVQSSLRSGFRTTATALDASPDSVIFTLESNFSLFSSASASVDRCSFTSDALDHDSLASSDISLHLAGHEGGGGGGGSSDQLHRQESNGWSGPDRDSDPKKVSDAAAAAARSSTKKHNHNRSRPRLKVAKASAQNQNQKEDNNGAADDASAAAIDDDSDQFLDSARSSFSLALKECQDRRARSEAFARKLDRRRPASLDLNNVAAAAASSPRLGTLKKASVSSSSRPSGGGNFPSPGTPNYRLGMQKGWSSERVPLPNGVNRRNVNAAAALLPFNNNGRTLPSKWEDAERWIFSPISGDGPMRTSVQQAPHQRRPKSKSGPLGPPGVAYYSLYSPAAPVFDGIGGSVGNFVAGSPFSTGVIAADGLAMRSSNAHGLAFPPKGEPCMARSVSVHGCSDMVGQSSLPFQDEKHEGVKDAATDISRTVSRRDMATQMSPEGSKNSSPSRRLSFSASTPSDLPIVEVQSVHSYKSEVRDVQVDERVTFTRWSKKHRNRNNGTTSGSIDSWRKKVGDAPSCPWEASEAAKSISKVKREEAKITAWENLQKAKAEAAIRKLEMKLEKKRSSSIDKIMSKLKSAQKKAQEMRSSVLANQAHQVSRTSHKAISFRRTRHMGSLSGCFTCHAF